MKKILVEVSYFSHKRKVIFDLLDVTDSYIDKYIKTKDEKERKRIILKMDVVVDLLFVEMEDVYDDIDIHSLSILGRWLYITTVYYIKHRNEKLIKFNATYMKKTNTEKEG